MNALERILCSLTLAFGGIFLGEGIWTLTTWLGDPAKLALRATPWYMPLLLRGITFLAAGAVWLITRRINQKRG